MADFGPQDPHKRLADIFSKMKAGQREVLLKDLDDRDPAAAERIKSLMFVFDDLAHVDARSLQELLRHVERQTLTLALKGAHETVQAAFYASMSARAAKLLAEDIDALGAVRTQDVESARAIIIATAKRLADDGKIILGGTDDEYVE